MDLRTKGILDYWVVEDTRFLASTACVWEASARKLGNVHPGADFPDLTHLDFVIGGCALGSAFSTVTFSSKRVGRTIWHAVARSMHVARSNSNLGIALLIAPLAAVDGMHLLSIPEVLYFDLKKGVPDVLAALTIGDAVQTYEAIRLANPGGLGDARKQDVRDEPTVTLLEAMKLAADRDMIARQYANGFADVFDFGTPALLEAFAKFGTVEAAIVDCQLRWLAACPDSLIARKNGLAVAEDVQKRAAAVLELGGIATPEGRAAGVALDKHLRSDGNKLNPGTTADLIAACLFVALREGKIAPSAPFRWHSPDWLSS